MAQVLRVYVPLLLLGGVSGWVYTLSVRAPSGSRRRWLQITWILMLLAGAPLWLLVAAALGWM